MGWLRAQSSPNRPSGGVWPSADSSPERDTSRTTRVNSGAGPVSGSWRKIIPGLCGVGAAVMGFLVWSYASFGTLGDAFGYLSGIGLVARPRVLSLGPMIAGERKTATVHLINLSDSPCAIVGARASCSCIATEELPVTLGPREHRDLHVVLTVGREPGTSFEQSVVYQTDRPTQPRLNILLRGQVVRSPQTQ